MATGVGTQISLDDHALFMPSMTVKAMRDSRYRHPALAVAELIDNSIDARSRRVDVLIREHKVLVKQRHHWRVEQLAVFDNGRGMSADTLIQALRFGGHQPSGSVRQIGKYGMGLPTASVSQCRRLDVWTWDNDIDRPHYSYIDVGEIESGGLRAVPQPESRQIPRRWMDAVSPDTVNSEHGTLVVWSDVDRIVAQSKTIFKQLETEIGRIYRRYIYGDELTIRMASFRPTESRPQTDRYVRPNDPFVSYDWLVDARTVGCDPPCSSDTRRGSSPSMWTVAKSRWRWSTP